MPANNHLKATQYSFRATICLSDDDDDYDDVSSVQLTVILGTCRCT